MTRIQNIYLSLLFPRKLQLEERQTETDQEIASRLVAGRPGVRDCYFRHNLFFTIYCVTVRILP